MKTEACTYLLSFIEGFINIDPVQALVVKGIFKGNRSLKNAHCSQVHLQAAWLSISTVA